LFSSAGSGPADIGPPDLFAATLNKPVKHDQLFDILLKALTGSVTYVPKRQPTTVQQLSAQFPLRILVAEDNVVNQKVLLRVLKEIGYTGDVAGNGVEVLDAIREVKYDLIFMDVHMPEMDGLETSRRIVNSLKPGERPIIVALTADALQGDRDKCVEAGMDDYITKPIRIADIQRIIEQWGQAAKAARPEQASVRSDAEMKIEKDMFERIRQLGLESDPAFVLELIESYTPLFANHSKNVEIAFENRDMKKLRYAAHSLKGASLNIGANSLGEICKTIEDLAESGSFDALGPSLKALKTELKTAAAALEGIKEKFQREIPPAAKA
jgi:CheY-like chemotaxis protein